MGGVVITSHWPAPNAGTCVLASSTLNFTVYGLPAKIVSDFAAR